MTKSTTTRYRCLKTTKTQKFDKLISLIRTRKIWKSDDIAIKICDVIKLWLIDNENQSVEQMLLVKKFALNDLINLIDLIDLFNVKLMILSSAICEILAIWLIKRQNRNVELKQLIKKLKLNDLINLIDLNDLFDRFDQFVFFRFCQRRLDANI